MNFNIALIGEQNVGKTTWMRRLITGEFIKNHVTTTDSANKFVYKENTYDGLVTFNVTELKNVTNINMNNFDGIIVMFSVISKASFNYAKNILRNLQTWYPKIPVVLCGNQVDRLAQHDRAVPFNLIRNINYIINKNYFDISARTNYHFNKPFLYLIQRLTNNNNAQIIVKDAILPVEIF